MKIMSIELQIAMIIGALCALCFVLYEVKKLKMNIKFSIVWILWALLVLVLGLFPSLALKFAHMLGIVTASNFVFLMMVALLYVLSFYVYVVLSKMNNEIKRLGYEVAMLKKEVKDEK